jgi:hypothetical protein
VGSGIARLAVRRLEEFLDADVVLAVLDVPDGDPGTRACGRGRLCAPLVVHLTDPPSTACRSVRTPR